jgi:hypothetical protein
MSEIEHKRYSAQADPARASRHPGHDACQRLCSALSEWGRLILQCGARGDASVLEQVIGGLVDWMGNELLDGWLHLPIPTFEAVSGLAEELFQASQELLAAVRAGGGPATDPATAPVGRIEAVLDRVKALAAAEDPREGGS